MNKYLTTTFILILFYVLVSFAPDRLANMTPNVAEQVANGWPMPVYDYSKNPSTRGGIALGRKLFYEPKLAVDGSIGCASCHLSYTAFTHVDHKLSHGVGDSVGIRNSLALVNLAWHTSFMWDGAINHLDVQALAPIEDIREMATDIKTIVNKLEHIEPYPRLFYKAFGDSSITGERVLKALSQFQLTLISANSKYDKVMRNEDSIAFTPQESHGYELFKINCAVCHQEPLFTNGNFINNGLPVDTLLNDFGRMRVTNNSDDSLKFKVPTLRNVEFSFPYMHDGRFKRLADVLIHYDRGVHKSATLAPILNEGIKLTSYERVDLIAFLLTLTDKEFLFNPDHAFPR